MRKNDNLKKLIVVGAAVLTLIGIFPADFLGGNVTVSAAQKIWEKESDSSFIDTESKVVNADGSDAEESRGIEAEDPESQQITEEELVVLPAYVVTDMSATLYAQKNSNVRRGPSTDYDVIGGLALNQEAIVTGRADTGWYRIEYKGGEGFVSGSLLGKEPVVVATPDPVPVPQDEPVQETVETPQPTEAQPKQRWEYTEAELIQLALSQCITADMSDWDKAVAVNNYLCNLMSYDYSFTHRSTFDALAYGSGVCQGYANAYQKMMNAAGVSTDFIAGYGWNGSEWGSHAWNRVLIGGQYYYVDVTWNDCLSNTQYLLISYEQMSYDHVEERINPQNRVK